MSNSDMTSRLHAARLAAGFLMSVDVANALGVDRATYSRIEAGKVALSDVHRRALEHLFGITESFLNEGVAKNAVDLAASRIEQVLVRSEAIASDVGLEAAERLRGARLAAGFKSALAAAAAGGWVAVTYAANESGRQKMPVDRLVGYSMSLGIRPEYTVLAEGKMFPAESETCSWWRQARASEGKPTQRPDALTWKWLHRARAPGKETFPLLEMHGGTVRLADSPLMSLPQKLLGTAGSTLYGLLDQSKGEQSIWIIDPSSSAGKVVEISSNGTVTAAQDDGRAYVPVDVVRLKNIKSRARLGLLVKRVVLRD